MIVTVSGPTLISELNNKSAQLNRFYEAETAASIAADLVSGTGWTVSVAAPFATEQVSISFMGKTRLQSLLELCEILHCHLREDQLDRIVYLDDFGEDTSVFLTNIERATVETRTYDYVGLIESLKTTENSEVIINKIIPVGSGEGINVFTLRWATRSIANGDPYDVQTGTLPDGSPYYYIADAASITALGGDPTGVREAVIPFKDITPLANTPTAFENASNALYDLAVEVMQRRKDPIVEHEVEATFNKVLPLVVGKYVTCRYAERIEGAEQSEPTRTNLVPNGGFETNTTGWGSDQTIARVTTHSRYGSASLRTTSSGAGGTMLARTSLTLTAQYHAISADVFIPSAWTGGQIRLRANSLTGAIGTVTALADMGIRDQWQRLSAVFSPVSGDLTVDADIDCISLGGAGQVIYTDGVQIEVGTFPTSYIETDGAPATRESSLKGHTVSGELIIVDRHVNYSDDGTTKVSMKLTPQDTWLLSNEEITIGTLETLAGIRVNLKLYSTFQDHGTMRESIETTGSHWFRYKVRYTEFTHFVHGCWIDFDLEGLKSNTKTVSAKSADTSGPSSDETAGSSTHTHTISTTPQTTSGASPPISDGHTHGYIGVSSAIGASGSHTHDIAHEHDIPGHNHNLAYGIFRDSLPSPATTQLYVNGVLHGTYTTDQAEIDISDKVIDVDGQPLRQENIVEFRTSASKAYDVVAHAYSFVSVSAIGRGVA